MTEKTLLKFGITDHGYVAATKAINKMLYQAPREHSWLKTLLLSQESQSLKNAVYPPLKPFQGSNIFKLNPEQQSALVSMCSFGKENHERVSICQGPPGTGKTRVIVQAVLYNLQQNRPVLVCTETHEALAVCATAIKEALSKINDDDTGMYLIEESGLKGIVSELHPGQVTSSTEDAFIGSSFENLTAVVEDKPNADDDYQPISQSVRQKLVDHLQKRRSRQPFSLTSHIDQRLALFKINLSNTKAHHPMKKDEEAVLRDLCKMGELLKHSHMESVDAQFFKKIGKAFDKAWTRAQRYYLQNETRVVLVTASSAVTIILRNFRPLTIIMDEASQLLEITSAAAMSQFLYSLRKIVLVGDPNQNGPFVAGKNQSEVSRTSEMSKSVLNLLEIMIY